MLQTGVSHLCAPQASSSRGRAWRSPAPWPWRRLPPTSATSADTTTSIASKWRGLEAAGCPVAPTSQWTHEASVRQNPEPWPVSQARPHSPLPSGRPASFPATHAAPVPFPLLPGSCHLSALGPEPAPAVPCPDCPPPPPTPLRHGGVGGSHLTQAVSIDGMRLPHARGTVTGAQGVIARGPECDCDVARVGPHHLEGGRSHPEASGT